jgi:N-hydroxyarylamine O-acetyltransferase
VSAFDFEAYRARIGLGEVRPDLTGLGALQAAHLRAVPFENFDPLLGRVPAVDLAGICAKIVDRRRGGYCFEQNSLFDAALKAAGFSTRRALARVRMRFGTEAARSHLVLLVEIDGQVWLTDVGFGGPGSLAPLLLKTGTEQRAPNGTYRFTEDAEREETVLERLDGDGWFELYAFDCSRVSDGEIAAANYSCATWSEAPFSSHLLLGCFVGDVRYGVFDRSLSIERPDGTERREFIDLEDFAEFIEGEAGIRLSREELGEAWRKIASVP